MIIKSFELEKLNNSKLNIHLIYGNNEGIKQDIIKGRLKDWEYAAFKGHKMPRVLFLEIGDSASQKFKKKLTIDVEFEDKLYTYTLDSAVLRNTAKHHFSSYIHNN